MTNDLPVNDAPGSPNNWATLPLEEALARLGVLIDSSLDNKNPEYLRRAIAVCEELSRRDLSPNQAILLDYLSANAWSNLRVLSRIDQNTTWEWQQEEFEKEILYLRRALSSSAFGSLSRIRRCQILTNLANALNSVGRFVEATQYWDRALEINSTFGMARGNRGYGLTFYARCLYDDGHRILFLKHAHRSLKAALESKTLHQDARRAFEQVLREIEAVVPEKHLDTEDPCDTFSLGETNEEIAYRKWCLAQRLFLNPLNDLTTDSIAAHDVLTTPSIVMGIDEGPYYPGFYNQMKQEFVSARYFLYEGMAADSPHYSDQNVSLYDTLDYPAYSLAIERTKAAFRTVYSLLDKIAFFLNHYMDLKIPERQVSFRTFWYESQNRRKGLKPVFQRRANLPLRGLFWLSKDLYEDQPGFREAMEPDARDLAEIRNHLEHKYLKVHNEPWMEFPGPQNRIARALSDTLAHSLRRADLETKTLRLMNMTRAAMIYLSLAIHVEEQRRAAQRPQNKYVLPMFLDLVEDDWKT